MVFPRLEPVAAAVHFRIDGIKRVNMAISWPQIAVNTTVWNPMVVKTEKWTVVDEFAAVPATGTRTQPRFRNRFPDIVLSKGPQNKPASLSQDLAEEVSFRDPLLVP